MKTHNLSSYVDMAHYDLLKKEHIFSFA